MEAFVNRVLKAAEKVRREVVLVGGVLITVGEAVSPSLPSSARTYYQVALPIVVTIVQRARTVPVGTLTQIVQSLEKRQAGR